MSRTIIKVCLLLVLVGQALVAGQVAALAEDVTHPVLGYTLRVPEGFVADAALAAANPNFTHAFRKTTPGDDVGLMLIVERLRGTIGGERLKRSDLPPGLNAQLTVLNWQGVDIDLLEFNEETPVGTVFNFNAQIPLRKEAIQLRAAGSAQRSVEVRTTLLQALAGLKGETNRIPSVLPSRGNSGSPLYPFLLGAVAIAIIGCGAFGLWRVAHSDQRHLAIVLAIALWVMGMMLAAVRVREAKLVGGAMSMTGFLGLGIWVVALIRGAGGSRRPRSKKKSGKPVRKRRPTQYDEFGNVIEE